MTIWKLREAIMQAAHLCSHQKTVWQWNAKLRRKIKLKKPQYVYSLKTPLDHSEGWVNTDSDPKNTKAEAFESAYKKYIKSRFGRSESKLLNLIFGSSNPVHAESLEKIRASINKSIYEDYEFRKALGVDLALDEIQLIQLSEQQKRRGCVILKIVRRVPYTHSSPACPKQEIKTKKKKSFFWFL